MVCLRALLEKAYNLTATQGTGIKQGQAESWGRKNDEKIMGTQRVREPLSEISYPIVFFQAMPQRI